MLGIHAGVTSKEQVKKIIFRHSEVIQSSLVYIDENCYSFDKGIGFTLLRIDQERTRSKFLSG